MRILFANNLCGHYGGVEQVMAHTVRALRRRGHECYLAFGEARSDAAEYSALFAGVWPCREISGGTPSGGETFAEITARVQPDVVFVQKVSNLPEGVEHATAYRTVVMVHDHDLWCPTGLGYARHNRQLCRHNAGWRCYLSLAFIEKNPGGRLPFRFNSIQRKVCGMRRYHRFDSILANSRFIREKLLANGFPGDRTHLCHPVLNQEALVPDPVPETPEVLYVGSLIRGKGVDLLLRALATVQCPFTLNVVGTGKSEATLRELAKHLKIDGQVNFAGWVPNEEVARYYRSAKVVAVPSAWPEPFGLVGLEAMRHGRPVVAFRVGGIPDWLVHEETGLMAPPLDTEALAGALERLLGDTGTARRFGAKGAERVREQFSFSMYIDQLERHLTRPAEPT